MYIVDRIEGELVICEDDRKRQCKFPLAMLPKNVKEGDCLRKQNSTFYIDEQETRERKKRVRKLMDSLFE